MKYPKGVLLDLDDTILSFNAYVDHCWRKVSRSFSEHHGGPPVPELLAAIDKARKWYWSDLERHRQGRLKLDVARREVVAMALEQLGIDDRSLAVELADSYGKEIDRHARPFPGAIDTIKQFREKKIKLALLTNGSKEFQRRKIDRFELEPLFDHIVIEGEFGVGKPDDRIFKHALGLLKLKASDVWMVGDDLDRDIAGAQKAGIYSIWVDWQKKGLPESSPVRPDRIVSSIAELVS